ncbi:hypothetical protein BCY76_008070 [Nesterenkonia sp. PF2B19]|nr:hypothetical protein BCY76_008070 [Nesterenkonia sp. PF2B19]
MRHRQLREATHGRRAGLAQGDHHRRGRRQIVDWVDQERTIGVELTSPSDTELQVAAQMGVTITHSAMMPLDAEVSYGDRIEVDGEVYQLQSDPLSSTHSAIARATVRKTPFDETTS